MKPPLSKQSIVDVLGFWLSQVMLIKTGIHHSMVDSSCGKNHVRTIRRLRQAQVGLNISLVDGWCVPIESCSPGGVRFGCNLFSLIKRYGVLLVTHAAYLGPEGYDIYHIYVIYIYNITYYIYYVYIHDMYLGNPGPWNKCDGQMWCLKMRYQTGNAIKYKKCDIENYMYNIVWSKCETILIPMISDVDPYDIAVFRAQTCLRREPAPPPSSRLQLWLFFTHHQMHLITYQTTRPVP